MTFAEQAWGRELFVSPNYAKGNLTEQFRSNALKGTLQKCYRLSFWRDYGCANAKHGTRYPEISHTLHVHQSKAEIVALLQDAIEEIKDVDLDAVLRGQKTAVQQCIQLPSICLSFAYF